MLATEHITACYKVHKLKLAESCKYFNSLMLDDNQSHTIYLPDTYQWSSGKLNNYVDFIYGKYDSDVQNFEFS